MASRDEHRKRQNGLAECHRQAVKAGDHELARALMTRMSQAIKDERDDLREEMMDCYQFAPDPDAKATR